MDQKPARSSLAGNFTRIKKPEGVSRTDAANHQQRPDSSLSPLTQAIAERSLAASNGQERDSAPQTPQQIKSSDRQTSTSEVWERVFTTIQSLDSELKEAFVEDAQHCVNAIERTLLETQKVSTPAEEQLICRELHNLKGASASVGLVELSSLLHELEETYGSNRSPTTDSKATELYKTIDRIRAAIQPPLLPDSPPHQVNEPERVSPRLLNASTTVDSTEGMVRVEIEKLNRLMDSLAQLVILRNRRDTEIQSLQMLTRELPTTASKVRSLGAKLTDLGELDDASFAAEIANDLHEIHRTLHLQTRPLLEGNSAVTNFISDFRRELTSLRRTPLRGLAQRLHRLAVDTARLENKEIDFEFIGEQERLETHLQQTLIDALIHVTRNAVCHGIETPGQRKQCEKPSRGRITIRVHASPETLQFEVSDDGRGLNFESIQRKAIQLGLANPGEILPRDELSKLILRPGFTTRSNISSVAGRGIGLDVVASDLEKMRGWIDIASTAGLGTTIRLRVPIPSLIQHVVVFTHHGQNYGVPMHTVLSTGQANSSAASLRFPSTQKHTPNTPTANLLLDLKDATESNSDAAHPPMFNLWVDEVIGPEEMVVRPIPNLIRSHPYITGVTLSGRGTSVLIVNPVKLARWCESDSDLNNIPAVEDVTGNAKTLQTDANQPGHARHQRMTQTAVVLSDSISIRSTIRQAFSNTDYTVAEFYHFKEAASFARTNPADILILDSRSRITHFIDSLSDSSGESTIHGGDLLILGSPSETELRDARKFSKQLTVVAKPISAEKVIRAIAGLRTSNQIQQQNRNLMPEDQQ
ncbi:MAG: Hpt domain-containing protein [Rubripirellula sp.]|nr:Hpt domain-containing protein [Rubripirellula sp.]